MPPIKPLFDASHHRPRFAAVDASDPHVRAAADARADYIARISDAWRSTPSVAPTSGVPPADQPDGESPRDAYIRRVQSAYRTPFGQAVSDPDEEDDDANAIEAQRQRWLKPGATPGTTTDAATGRALADAAYSEYVARLQNAWRR